MSEVETIVLKKPKKKDSQKQKAATARLVESNRLKTGSQSKSKRTEQKHPRKSPNLKRYQRIKTD